MFKIDEDSAGAMEEDPYYKQFKYHLYLFRIFGRIPFQRSETGKLQVRYFSQVAFYSVVAFSTQLYGMYFIYLWQIPHITSSQSFDNVISSLMVLLFLNFHYDILLHSWWEAPKLIAYYEHWKLFNEKLMEELGIKAPSRLSFRIKLVLVIVAVIYATIILIETEVLLQGLKWYLCWPLFNNVYNLTLISSFWFTNCIMICHTADELNSQFIKMLKSNPYRHQISKYRILILELRNLTKEFGNVFSRTIVSGLLNLLLIIILSLYGAIAITLQEDFNKLIFFIFPLFYGLINFFLCYEGAHRASNLINNGTLTKILGFKLVSLRKEVYQEVELLLDTITCTPANIEPLGLFSLNRNTFTQVIGAIVSYLVVLAQFRETDEEGSQ